MFRSYQHGSEPSQPTENRQTPTRPLNNAPPPSFKTNVNRAKTKRWVEAKSFSYDGDDWGGVDDYDEYGGYDEPASASRPTGLRQQGQSAVQALSDGYGSREDNSGAAMDDGGMPSYGYRVNQGPMQQQSRSATNPQAYTRSGNDRSNSFSGDEERRSFSTGVHQYATSSTDRRLPQPSQGQAPAMRSLWLNQNILPQDQPLQSEPTQANYTESPIDAQSRSSLDGPTRPYGRGYPPPANYQGVSYPDRHRDQGNGSRSQSMTSNTSSSDFHGRRDFSPSALPPPLHTRASPAPSNQGDGQTNRYPPRKSSLSRQDSPHVPLSSNSMPLRSSTPESAMSSRDRAGSNSGKPLPFVRPADIYKRMHEERERERQSQESSRRSMDGIMDAQAGLAHNSSADDNVQRPRKGANFEGTEEDDSVRRLKPLLDPVTERKSEYGLEGLTSPVPEEKSVIQQRGSTTESVDAEHQRLPGPSNSQSIGSPVLPDVTRMSGFGESLLGSINDVHQVPHSVQRPDSDPKQPGHLSPPDITPLHHHPSLGFRSVVNQAFDRPDDQVPPTPASAAGSGVARSNSESTSGVSPIISRASSTAGVEQKAKDAEAREKNIPMITEEPNENNPRSSSSSASGMPTQMGRKSPPFRPSQSESTGTIPTYFIPGHRRNISTPSPDNSPARTPALEVNRQLPQPQEVELAMATPVEPGPDYTSREADIARTVESSPGKPSPSTIRAPRISFLETQTRRNPESPTTPATESPSSRTGSPNKSKVRDLAEKFESNENTRRGSEQSPPLSSNASVSGGPKLDDLAPPRPLADRMESFRPHLPGGWESYASAAPNRVETPEPFERQGENNDLGSPDRYSANESEPLSDTSTKDEDIELTPTTVKRTLSKAVPKDQPITDPFSAVAAAGTALAGAIAAAVGMDHERSATPTSEDGFSQGTADPDSFLNARGRSASLRDTAFHPEASKPFISPDIDDDDSSAAPTPLPKDFPPPSSDSVASSEYFAPVAPLQKRPRSIITTSEELITPARPPMLPTLSTDTSPQDYESDRLRKELVRELSPRFSRAQDERPDINSSPSIEKSRISAQSGSIPQGHESMFLPKEYDSYWNGSNSGDDTSRRASNQEATSFKQSTMGSGSMVGPSRPSIESDEHSRELGTSDAMQPRPGMLTHRFSWEPEQEEINNPDQALSSSGNVSEHPTQDTRSTKQNESQPRSNISDTTVEQNTLLSNANSAEDHFRAQDAFSGSRSTDQDTPVTARSVLAGEARKSGDDRTVENPRNRGSRELYDKLNLHGDEDAPEAVESSNDKTIHDSFVEETAASENRPLSSLQPPEHRIVGDAGGTSDYPSHSTQLPTSPPPNGHPKIPAFREILALKTPAERIQACNDTREQFANLDTGLTHWIATTINDIPEHSSLISSSGQFAAGGMSYKPSPARGRMSGLRLPGQQQTQQPYYQQYLNASAQPSVSSPTTATNTPSGSVPSQSYHSPTGAGSKLSSQHVQAKGKDLFHSAGVFGGKANVAAKGLFSKGKNRLRGSGGVDKALPTTPSPDSSLRGMQQLRNQSQQELKPQPQALSSYQSHPRSASLAGAAQNQSSNSSLPSHPFSLADPSYLQKDAHQNGRTASPSSVVLDDRGNGTQGDDSRQVAWPPANTSLEMATNPSSRSDVIEMGESSPVVPKQSAPHRSDNETSTGIQSPRSATSSNRTPTQADFTGENGDTPADPMPWHDPEMYSRPTYPKVAPEPVLRRSSTTMPDSLPEDVRAQTPNTANDGLRLREGLEQNVPTQSQPPFEDQLANTSIARQRPMVSRTSEDSEGTFHTADNGVDPVATRNQVVRSPSIHLPSTLVPSQEIGRSTSPLPNDEPPQGIPQASERVYTSGLGQELPRPFSFIEYGPDEPQHLRDRSPIGDTNTDNRAAQVHQDRPSSPVSPQRSIFDQQSQEAPAHYDVHHDFLSDHSSAVPTRHRSFSRPFQDLNIEQHPAFRHESPPTETAQGSKQFYPAQIRREDAMLPRQQATEYQLEGVGPPPADLANNSRSRRGSRSSAFFKNLNLSPRDTPPVPVMVRREDTNSSTASPVAKEKNAKRTSIFRTLTGYAGSENGRSKEIIPAQLSRSRTDLRQKSDASALQGIEPVQPTKGNENKASKKLHRASTSGVVESNGKKKRFSALGTLFGRSKPSKSASASPQTKTFPPSARPHLQSQHGSSMDSRQPSILSNERRSPNDQPSAYYATRQAYDPPPSDYTEPPLRGYYSPDTKVSRPGQRFAAGHHVASQPQHMQPDIGSSTLPAQYHDQYQPRQPYPDRTSSRQPQLGHSSYDGYSNHIQRASSSGHHDNYWPGPTSSSLFGQVESRQAANADSINPDATQAVPHSSSNMPRSTQESLSPRSFDGFRPVSPPPPPPPPKDEWHLSNAKQRGPTHVRSASRSPNPDRESSYLTSSTSDQRQSLPPLQTNLNHSRHSSREVRNITPEEVRIARRQEIERAGMSPEQGTGARGGDARQKPRDEEEIVMSSSSYPGQEWQPNYADWDRE